jgi:hypothetical protein
MQKGVHKKEGKENRRGTALEGAHVAAVNTPQTKVKRDNHAEITPPSACMM